MKISDKVYSIILFAIYVLFFSFFTVFILSPDIRKVIILTPDDSSYYLKIAKNFSEGQGLTFDGINQTNGFHPLWMLLLIPLIAFSNAAPENTLRIVLFFQLILSCFSAIIFYNIVSRYFEKKIVLASAVIFILFVISQTVNGMETSLMVLLLLIVFLMSIKLKIFSEHNIGNEIFWGAILGLAILSRLDMVFISFGIGTFLLYYTFFNSSFKKENVYSLIAIISGAAIVVLPYLLFNLITFGNIIPISGYLKSTFPHIRFEDKFATIIRYRETYFAASALIYLIWFGLNYKRLKGNKSIFFYLCLATLSVGILFLFLYLFFFLNWVLYYWYFIPYSFFISFLVCIPLKYILSLKKFNSGAILFWIFTIFVTFYWGYKIYISYTFSYRTSGESWNLQSYNTALWTKENTNNTDIFAMKDAGHFSFFSERKVINLDGLVNNFEYQEIIKNKKLNEYLRNNNVKFLVQHAVRNREDVAYGNYDTLNLIYTSHKYSLQSDPVIVNKKDEVYRSDPYNDEKFKVAFIIWKFNF